MFYKNIDIYVLEILSGITIPKIYQSKVNIFKELLLIMVIPVNTIANFVKNMNFSLSTQNLIDANYMSV